MQHAAQILTLSWPRQLPIEGEPRHIVELVNEYSQWMSENEIPKLFVSAETAGRSNTCRFLPGAPDSSVSLARAMRPRQSELIGQDADRDEAALLVWERKIDKMDGKNEVSRSS